MGIGSGTGVCWEYMFIGTGMKTGTGTGTINTFTFSSPAARGGWKGDKEKVNPVFMWRKWFEEEDTGVDHRDITGQLNKLYKRPKSDSLGLAKRNKSGPLNTSQLHVFIPALYSSSFPMIQGL